MDLRRPPVARLRNRAERDCVGHEKMSRKKTVSLRHDELPRCSRCGYALVGLSLPRCPECGTGFDSALVVDAAKRSALLAWERRERGGPLRRFTATLLLAWFRPDIHLAKAARRAETPIANVGTLIWLTVIAAVLIHVVSFVVEYGVFYFEILWKSPSASQAYSLTLHTAGITSSAHLSNLYVIAGDFVSLAGLSCLLNIFSRRCAKPLRTIDLLALLGPAAVLAQVFRQLYLLTLLSPDPLAFDMAGLAIDLGQYFIAAYLCLIAWLCCRRLLALGVSRCMGTAALSVLLVYLVYENFLRAAYGIATLLTKGIW